MLNPRADRNGVELMQEGLLNEVEELVEDEEAGGAGGRRAGLSDPDNCRQRETELGCGQSNKRRERGNKVYWSQACIITTVERSTIWHRQQGIQGFMKGVDWR